MADESPRKTGGKKRGKTLKEERTAKKLMLNHRADRPRSSDGPAPSVTPPVGCWYGDPQHQPRLGWCPVSCHGPLTHSERTGNGDQHVYCEAHAHWRRKTIRLPLVRRLRPGERPNPAVSLPASESSGRVMLRPPDVSTLERSVCRSPSVGAEEDVVGDRSRQ
jgi:hypothetical protein